jgi:cell wall assembly regulator SMI1
MTQQRTLEETWSRFIDYLAEQAPQAIASVRVPASSEAIEQAEQRLNCALPEALRQLYALADGFAADAYLLRDEYRILPLNEMVEASLGLVGEPVVLDALAGEVAVTKKVTRLVFAQARDDDPDVSQVSLRLWARKRPSVELWYREGGIHDFEEVVDWDENLATWLDECLEYYA